MGGLPRRATLLSREQAEGPGALILDTGNTFTDKPVSEASAEAAFTKARLMVDLMSWMGYDAAGIGEMELYFGLEKLRALQDQASFPFLSANLTDPGGKPLFEPFRISEMGPVTVGVLALTNPPSNTALFRERMGENKVGDPFEAAASAVSRIRQRCNLVVVLSSLGYNRDLELARAVDGIDIIVGGGSRRFMRKPTIENGTIVSTGFFQGRAVGKITVTLKGGHRGWASGEELAFLEKQIQTARDHVKNPGDEERLSRLREARDRALALTRYDADMVNLSPDIPDDAEVNRRIAEYRKQLKADQPVADLGDGGPVRYIGPEPCRECHEGRHRFWSRTPHASAFQTLSATDADADPDCLPCHVTGYERVMGYWRNAPRPYLEGVGCEACHGVGALHAAAPDRYSLVTLPLAPQCMDCHTDERDDDFDYLKERSLVCSEE